MNSKVFVSSKDKQIKQYKLIRIRKISKTLKNHREKMSGRVNVRMSKIMRTPIKVGVRTYATYDIYQTLQGMRWDGTEVMGWLVRWGYCRMCQLINLYPKLFASVLPSLVWTSEACYITFMTRPMMKTCVDQSELVNVGAQTD